MIGHPATFDEFAAAARASKTQATNLVNRTCFRLGTLIATIANLAMPDKIMIAGESSFIAKLGIDNLRNGINMYRHSQAAPVFEIARARLVAVEQSGRSASHSPVCRVSRSESLSQCEAGTRKYQPHHTKQILRCGLL